MRLPPEWIPWPATGATTCEVLFSSSRTARIGRAFLNSTVVSLGSVVLVRDHQRHGRLSAGPHAVPAAANVDLRAARRQPHGAEAVILVPQYVLDPAARLAQHLPGADRPRGGDDLRLRRLPAPPVLPDDAAASSRTPRASTARERLAGVRAHRAAAVPAGARRAGDLRLPVGLERLPLAADRREQAGHVPAARSRSRCCAAPTRRSPTARSWPGRSLSALPLLLVFLVANRRIVEGVRLERPEGLGTSLHAALRSPPW